MKHDFQLDTLETNKLSKSVDFIIIFVIYHLINCS